MKIFRKKNGVRKIQLIRQRNANENGLACVAMLVNYYGPSVSIADIQKAHPEIASDANLRQIIETLSFYKISTTAYRCDMEGLVGMSRPCLIYWKLRAFVILTDIIDDNYIICDPSSSKQEMSYPPSLFHCYFSGIVLVKRD